MFYPFISPRISFSSFHHFSPHHPGRLACLRVRARPSQSNIIAQYILLLLVDYCTKGACNAEDQKFAMEMGRQGMDKRNISLYAVSKAMGFIPRNKLGHSFFRYAMIRYVLRIIRNAVRMIRYVVGDDTVRGTR